MPINICDHISLLCTMCLRTAGVEVTLAGSSFAPCAAAPPSASPRPRCCLPHPPGYWPAAPVCCGGTAGRTATCASPPMQKTSIHIIIQYKTISLFWVLCKSLNKICRILQNFAKKYNSVWGQIQLLIWQYWRLWT